MSTMQRITLIGLYNWDDTLFELLSLPEGYNKETFINSLLLEHGEKLVLYSDPDFMKKSIGLWANKWNLELSRIYDALTAEYNPIYNYDRYEQANDSRKSKNSPNYQNIKEQTKASTSENKISADNSSDYQPENYNTSDMGTITQKIKGDTENLQEEYHHGAHMYGNIGVTTSAQMVTEVVKQRMEFNLYEAAGRLFANDLLIGIY